ncbi:MAG: hypothetical protein LBJ20_00980 [Candidatus Methanoplasma sp.]|nr:hypothetical protein [Candidatus Methanoplasma sp.]
MFANVSNYEMKMPKMYVELSEDEMEYDGGLFGLLLSAVGIGLSIIGEATGNQTIKKVSNVVTVIGAVASFGAGLVVATVVKAATTGVTSTVAKTVVAKVTTDKAAVMGAEIVCVDSLSHTIGIATW